MVEAGCAGRDGEEAKEGEGVVTVHFTLNPHALRASTKCRQSYNNPITMLSLM